MNYDGLPHNPLVYILNDISRVYAPSSNTKFNLYLDAGSGVADAAQLRISYDFTGDGSYDRIETYNYFATNDLPGWETYTETKGLQAQTGAFANLNHGRIKVEIWNAIGNHTIALRTSASTLDGLQSLITIPFTNNTTSTLTSIPTSTSTRTPTITATKTPVTVTLMSAAANDGTILESSENSNIGGTLNANATTLSLGDDSSRKQQRDILSFNTSGLPDNAVITKITLKLMKQSAVGSDPVAMFQGLMVDMKNGLFGTTALQVTDFQATPNATYGPFSPTSVNNWYNIDLSSGQAYVNKLSTSSGLTQIRLRFKLDDNNNAVANYLNFYSGNAPASNRPQLVITYIVP